jgi:uncharacterized membrane protein YuzA (DUF378 family)
MLMRMNPLTSIAFLLVIVGALNWGLIGLFDFNLVAALLGDMSIAARIVYVLVGLSAIWVLIWRFVPQHPRSSTAAGAPPPRT